MMRKLFTIFGALVLVTLFATQQGWQRRARPRLRFAAGCKNCRAGWLADRRGRAEILDSKRPTLSEESWFKEAAEVEATARQKSDVMTTTWKGRRLRCGRCAL